MKDKIKQLLESDNKDDQLIALNMIANNPGIDLDFIPYNGTAPYQYLLNNTKLLGYIKTDTKILLLGNNSFRLIHDEDEIEDLYPNYYKELDKNLEPL